MTGGIIRTEDLVSSDYFRYNNFFFRVFVSSKGALAGFF